MKSVKILSIFIIAIIIASTLSFTGCTKNESDKINIACNLPLTGDLATYGESVRDGSNFALFDLKNKAGENDLKLKFDWQDNQGEPKNSVNIMKSQYTKNVNIYISGVKPQTMSIIDEVSKKGTPHFVWIFDAFVCKNYKNTFRTWVSYKYEPDYYMEYVNKVKPKKIAIVYVVLPHTEEEFKNILIPRINNSGINDINVESYDITKKDFKDIATKVKEYKPDLIILNGFKANLIGLINSFRSQNLITDGNTIVTYDMLDAAEELSPASIEGIRMISPTFNVNKENKVLSDWKERFEKQFSRKPRYTDAYSYDMTNMIYEASKNLKNTSTSSEWSDALRKVNIQGITGNSKFDQDGDMVISLEIAVFRNGKLVPDIK